MTEALRQKLRGELYKLVPASRVATFGPYDIWYVYERYSNARSALKAWALKARLLGIDVRFL